LREAIDRLFMLHSADTDCVQFGYCYDVTGW
jgi:hypothetical protein